MRWRLPAAAARQSGISMDCAGACGGQQAALIVPWPFGSDPG
jgi:hypothetical protein